MATYFGLFVAGSAFLFSIWIIFKTLMFGEPYRGYPTIMITMLFLGGTQLIAIGILGEYIGRVFNETKRWPLFLINTFMPASSLGTVHDQLADTSNRALLGGMLSFTTHIVRWRPMNQSNSAGLARSALRVKS